MDARFERLLRAALPTARRLLAEHGELFPFTSVLRPEGEVEHLGPGLAEERPEARVVLDALLSILREERDEARMEAFAMISDVRVELEGEPATDAIRISLEHVQGAAVEVYAPYTVDGEGKRSFGEMRSRTAVPEVFPRQ